MFDFFNVYLQANNNSRSSQTNVRLCVRWIRWWELKPTLPEKYQFTLISAVSRVVNPLNEVLNCIYMEANFVSLHVEMLFWSLLSWKTLICFYFVIQTSFKHLLLLLASKCFVSTCIYMKIPLTSVKDVKKEAYLHAIYSWCD